MTDPPLPTDFPGAGGFTSAGLDAAVGGCDLLDAPLLVDIFVTFSN